MRWSHVALNCLDVARTEEFYRQFGFSRVAVFGDIVFLGNGSVHLELFPAPGYPVAGSGDGPTTPGVVRHLAFQVDDVDAVVAGLDAEITLGPLTFDEFVPGWRTVWVRDPDGVIVEVSQGFPKPA
ncbi:VOC family protein [Kibdelosporangium persicum]|uniref:Glyoxalase bleomycin resistance protein dioxygenase n=1 Tax=Kibdelosporangium persicum TaxID=2698649 RepID=A0ABX2F6P5_9PSEU|nr:VOC family protein [Kibdelosporangium persicum]NRN67028.1 Glyoxalase bleomycin resistance protein dioxygenase [Kibdelosporangium persicum]